MLKGMKNIYYDNNVKPSTRHTQFLFTKPAFNLLDLWTRLECCFLGQKTLISGEYPS